MSKDSEIAKLLRFAKGSELKKQFNRVFVRENGQIKLIKEIETDFEPIEMTYNFDNEPIKQECDEQRFKN